MPDYSQIDLPPFFLSSLKYFPYRNMNLTQRDKKIIWHPFTQEQTATDVIAIKKAQGSYLYDENDKSAWTWTSRDCAQHL
jgi:hypothetical protein